MKLTACIAPAAAWVLALLATLAPLSSASAEVPVEIPGEQPANATAVLSAPLLQRVFMIGASASSGFLLQADVGVPTSLTDVLEAALVSEHEPVQASTSLSFFLSPLASGEKQIDKALAYEPTLLLALDFLFWFGYGRVASEDARLERLEQGLWLLDKLEGPLVVCDLPDMSAALDGRGPFGVPMLRPSQIPRGATLERLNAMLAAWAAERGDVIVVPLALRSRVRRRSSCSLSTGCSRRAPRSRKRQCAGIRATSRAARTTPRKRNASKPAHASASARSAGEGRRPANRAELPPS